jgi:hypothetical protein
MLFPPSQLKNNCPFQAKIQSVDLLSSTSNCINSFSIDFPKTGNIINDNAVTIAGWVLPKTGTSLLSIEIQNKGAVLKRAKINIPRPDVAAAFNLSKETENTCGFHCEIGLLGLSHQFELDILVKYRNNQSSEPQQKKICRISAEKTTSFDIASKYQPIQVTAIGRSGTTLLMQILNQHKQILTTNFYPFEVKQAAYWLHFLQVSTAPADFENSSHPDKFEGIRYSIGHNPYNHPEYTNQYKLVRDVKKFYNSSTVNSIAQLCIERINEYYDIIANEENKPNAKYFAEKSLPNHLNAICTDLFPAPKEIILTRDFRDILCSARAFNTKRNNQAFGRDKVNDDFEWVDRISKMGARRLREAWQERKNQSLHVKYEDLILNTNSEIKRILDYLEIESTTSVISAIIKSVFSIDSSISIHQTTKDPKTSVGRWKTDMNEELKAHCRIKLGSTLESFGYDV